MAWPWCCTGSGADGTAALTADGAGLITRLDLAGERPLRTVSISRPYARSPDGKSLVGAGAAPELRVWRFE